MLFYVLDFETYWDEHYSVSKMTTEAYIRDPRFKAHLVGVVCTDGKNVQWKKWVPTEQIKPFLESLELHKHAAVAHHAQFDGLILSHHYGIRPKAWFCTMSMARPWHGPTIGVSLAALSAYYKLPPKGDDTKNTRGVRTLNPLALRSHGEYCMRDCENTFELFKVLFSKFDRVELKTIDMTIRMFTEPKLVLNKSVLQEELDDIRLRNTELLLESNASKATLMSNPQFAEALRKLGVVPPTKISQHTGKVTFAFAKTDPAMRFLSEEHPDPAVRALVSARMGLKSTIGETRATRMLEMASRGNACVYLNYWGALQTGRMSGGDLMNWQNFTRGSRLREAVEAPDGYMLVPGDLSNIENRVLSTLAQQWDAIERFRAYDRGEGEDPYCFLASRIYGYPVTPDDEKERRLGKIATLGLGFQMGVAKFITTASIMGCPIDNALATHTVRTFRETYNKVEELWHIADRKIPLMYTSEKGMRHALDPAGVLSVGHERVFMPGGMELLYPSLHRVEDGWQFNTRGGKDGKYLYGGKWVENWVQALARRVMMEVTVDLYKHMPIVLHAHDEAVPLVKEDDVPDAIKFIEETMTRPREWWPQLPLATKVHAGRNYKEAK